MSDDTRHDADDFYDGREARYEESGARIGVTKGGRVGILFDDAIPNGSQAIEFDPEVALSLAHNMRRCALRALLIREMPDLTFEQSERYTDVAQTLAAMLEQYGLTIDDIVVERSR